MKSANLDFLTILVSDRSISYLAGDLQSTDENLSVPLGISRVTSFADTLLPLIVSCCSLQTNFTTLLVAKTSPVRVGPRRKV